jgi:GNAT superfamily N-acetyltransferase
MVELTIRPGGSEDLDAVLALFDEAIAWLVARGLSGQWGEQPFSERSEMGERIRDTLTSGEGLIAEVGGRAVGALVLGSSPPYVPPNPVPELYVTLLISSRRLAGERIGARLLAHASRRARDLGRAMVRVDCWADSPRLVRFYEDQGFRRDGRFDLRGWRGQILSKRI